MVFATILLEAGADLDIVNHNGHTALILAEVLGNTEIIRLIKKYKKSYR